MLLARGGNGLTVGFQGIEAAFIARRARAPDLAGALAEAARHLQGSAAGGVEAGRADGLMRAGAAIAGAMDAWCGTHAELAYHNRHHAAEAALAMAWLCGLAQGWGLILPVQALAGVVAMLGHDFLHDGSRGSDGVLEARSGAAVAALAAAAGVGAADTAVAADVILATNPALAASNAARAAGRLPAGPFGCGHDLMRTLANEADICASLLPRLGPRLGEALAQEWGEHGAAGLAGASPYAGRLAFLRAVPPFSRPAEALGLQASHAACLAAYASAGAALRGKATGDAGCAGLDGLAPAAAQAAYDAAVQSATGSGAA